VLGNAQHRIVYTTKQFCDKIGGGHRPCSFALGFSPSIRKPMSNLQTSTIGYIPFEAANL
jgi:hypothetical protein